MYGLFLSVVLITAGIATSGLFYFFPQGINASSTQSVHSVLAEIVSITPADPSLQPTETTAITEPPNPISPTPLSLPPVSLTPVVFSPQPTHIPTIPPTVTPIMGVTITPPPLPTILPHVLSVTPPAIPTISLPPIALSLQPGLNAETLFSLVNDYRNKQGLAKLQQDSTVCAIATNRAPAIYNELFVSHTPDAGLKQINFPFWITETSINEATEQDAVAWWINDTQHRQILTGNYTHSCAACSGNSCVQIFTSYIAK